MKFISRNVEDVNGMPKRISNIMMQKISEKGLHAVLDEKWIAFMRIGAYEKYQIVDSLEEFLDSDIVVSCVSFAHSVIYENDSVFRKGCI